MRKLTGIRMGHGWMCVTATNLDLFLSRLTIIQHS